MKLYSNSYHGSFSKEVLFLKQQIFCKKKNVNEALFNIALNDFDKKIQIFPKKKIK
jgi:hypothetical protein